MEYFYELFCSLSRGGPGDNQSTRKAFGYLNILPSKPRILDIGCGPGMQTLELAKMSNGTIIALDNYQPFLDILMQNAIKMGVDERIFPKHQSMLEMDFKNNTFDVMVRRSIVFHGISKGIKTMSSASQKERISHRDRCCFPLIYLPKTITEILERRIP